MHVLITGGAGFIGSQTAEALLKRGDSVSVIDVFGYGYDPARKEANAELLRQYPRFRLYRGDIRDAELLTQIFEDNCLISSI